MKTYSLLFVLSMLLLAAFSPFTYAQSTILSIDPEREIIVMFKPNAVALPNGQNQGSLNDAQISSPTLQQALQNANVEILAKIVPNFRSQDRFIMTHTGERVELADWSNVYVIRLPQAQARNAAIGILSQISDVVYAEPNGQLKPALIPNDASFSQQWYLKNDGTAQQGNGTPGADIKATQAWDITTGSSTIKIAIVDGGMQTNHPDFTGRVTGDTGDNDGHGTTVTGVAAAQGNNSIGIAGVAWNVGIINEDFGNATIADGVAAVISAINRGAHVINNSYSTTTYATTTRNAFADAYKANRVAVAIMGNDYGQVTNYPAALGQGIIAVGATTNTNTLADYSTTGSWIDVAAPGGGGFGSQNENGDFIFTTIPSSGYSNFLSGSGIQGTSYSAPVVSGIAALLLSYNPGLYNDDIEQIIRLGTVDLGAPGFDNSFGTGRVDARKALDRLRSPYSIHQASASGGSDYSSTGTYTATFYSMPGLADGSYRVKRHEVRKAITFPYTFQGTPAAWGRGVSTNGYSAANPNFAMGYCVPVSGTITTTGATFQTYVYEVWNLAGQWIGWKPTTASGVTIAYTVNGIINPLAVNITGPGELAWKQSGTWTANASGGNGSFAYEWRYRNNGTGSWSAVVSTAQTYTRQMPNNDIELQVKVTSQGLIVYDTHYVSLSGGNIASQELVEDFQIPEDFSLSQNFPNPFNPETEIRFDLPEEAHVQVVIIDLLGREVRKLVDKNAAAGYHAVVWDGKDNSGLTVASGIYLYQMSAGNYRGVKKLTLVR